MLAVATLIVSVRTNSSIKVSGTFVDKTDTNSETSPLKDKHQSLSGQSQTHKGLKSAIKELKSADDLSRVLWHGLRALFPKFL